VTTCHWIFIFVGSAIVAAIIGVFMIPKSRREYWHGAPKLCWNEGWILDFLRAIFWFFDKIAIINMVTYCIPKRKCKYLAVDSYIAFLFIVESCLLLSIIFSWYTPKDFLIDCLIVGFIIWRLTGLFRVWVSHFVIAKDWSPISLYRTLILVFIGYLEITISYAVLAFILREHFEGIICWQNALDYSVRNAVTMGSPDIGAKDCVSYSLLGTQIMFVLLFLTAVVNSIITRR